jgi:hypothetical protein
MSVIDLPAWPSDVVPDRAVHREPVALAYRAAAIVDAWAIARAIGRGSRSKAARPARQAAATLSIAGLAAVLLVMSAVHVAVARYDLLLRTPRRLSAAAASVAMRAERRDRAARSDEPADSGARSRPACPVERLGPAEHPADRADEQTAATTPTR